MEELIKKRIEESIETKQKLIESQLPEIKKATEIIIE